MVRKPPVNRPATVIPHQRDMGMRLLSQATHALYPDCIEGAGDFMHMQASDI